jgi:autotransporter-associated beta strand protein
VNLSADNFFISSTGNLVVTAPASTFSGDLTVTGKLVAQSTTDTEPGLMAPSYKTFIDGITLTPSQINSLTTDYTPTANLSTSIVAEGTNLYFTDARARSAISVTGSLSYDAVNGVISFNDAVTSVNDRTGAVVLTSTDITEGTNKYFTDSRARAAISVSGSLTYNSASGVISFNDAVTSVNDRTGAVVLTSTEITEGSNLYFTNTRARNAISGTGGVVYDSATGSITLDSNIPKKDTVNVWTKQQACLMVSSNVSGSTTVNLDLGNVITLTPTAAFDIAAVDNAIAGGCYVFVIKQGATPFAGTFSSSKFKWANGVAPTLTAEANAVDVITFISDGTNLYAQSNYNYK